MKKQILSTLATMAIVLVAWLVMSIGIGNEYVLPTPLATFNALWHILGESSFYVALGGTLLRTALAFAVSILGGTALSLLAYLCPTFEKMFSPILSFIRTVPTMAIILILLLWTSPLKAPVIVSAMVLFPVVYTTTWTALSEVGRGFTEMAQSFKVPLHNRIFKMYLPLVFPTIFEQIGTWFSMGLKVTISAEILAFTYRSMGGMMQEAKQYIEMTRLFALTIVVIAIGFLIERVCHILVERLRRWPA